jgi:hypothetical protein
MILKKTLMKNLLNISAIFGKIAAFLFSSCQKDDINNVSFVPNSENKTIFNVGGDSPGFRSTDPVLTGLGVKRNNPYTVEKMTEAYNLINTIPVSAVSTTHYYVKFTPTTMGELSILINSEIELFDFPLENEVIHMGDYYLDPSQDEEDIPWYYAVVDGTFTLTGVPFEVLERLHIAAYESDLAKKAFEITNNDYDDELRVCSDGDPNWPDCQCDMLIGTPDWQDCIDQVNNTGGGSPTCTTFSDQRKPAGRIQVQDTQLGLEGLKNVKVTWWDGWFTVKKTQTDDDGCWSLNKREKGKAYMWVKFKNEKATVRTIRLNKFHQYLYAVQDYVGVIGAPPYNNIEVNYYDHVNVDSQEKRYWVSATAINAIDDYYDYASQDGFLAPPEDLNILLHTFGGADIGSAPMLQQSVNNSILYDYFKVSALALFPWGTLKAALLEVFEQTAPDITYTYGGLPSDIMKETLYHEFAHASHFRLVGGSYWGKLRWHVIANWGYGDPNAPNPGSAFGRVAVAEAWGFHIGPTFAERHYGTNHSNTNIPGLTEQSRFINILESRRFADVFIPRGLMLDLIDDNLNDYPTPGAYENTSITDNSVMGFSNSVIFDNIGANVTNPAEFENSLIGSLPTGVSAANLAALFAQY